MRIFGRFVWERKEGVFPGDGVGDGWGMRAGLVASPFSLFFGGLQGEGGMCVYVCLGFFFISCWWWWVLMK
jgi:hypothetical protein